MSFEFGLDNKMSNLRIEAKLTNVYFIYAAKDIAKG